MALQAAAQMGSGGMMVRVGSEQHLISDQPQQHMGRTPSDASYPALTGSPSHRPYSPGGGMPRSLPLSLSQCSVTSHWLSTGLLGSPGIMKTDVLVWSGLFSLSLVSWCLVSWRPAS